MIVKAWLAVDLLASVTMIVKGLDPLPVGRPEITAGLPVLVVSVRPAGRLPEEMLQVNGLVPPLR